MQPMQPQMPGAMPQMGPQQPGNPQVVQQMPQPLTQTQERLDNISKVKSLMGPLRDSFTLIAKSAAQIVNQNYLVDVGPQKAVDVQSPRFDKSIEEFYSVCNQMEFHLKTSIECLNQLSSSQRYLPLPVATARTEPLPAQDVGSLTYPQYLATVRAQVGYTKETHDVLLAAAQNIGMGE